MPLHLALLPVSRPADDDAIHAFLTGNTFPFHVRSSPTREQVRSDLSTGRYDGPSNLALWILENRERIGMAVLEDIEDPTLMMDLRLAGSARGRGVGSRVLPLLVDEAFRRFDTAIRLEGQTRADNVAMRGAFRSAGWVKEAYYRQAWPTEDGTLRDSVGYAVLRSDWATGETTPVPWNDEQASRP